MFLKTRIVYTYVLRVVSSDPCSGRRSRQSRLGRLLFVVLLPSCISDTMARTNYAANVDSIDRIHQEAADNRAMTAILFRAMMLMFFMWGVCSVLHLGLAGTAFMFAIILVGMVQQVVAEWQVAPRNLPANRTRCAAARASVRVPAHPHACTRAHMYTRVRTLVTTCQRRAGPGRAFCSFCR
jgi:hypothetical protein